MSLVDIVSLVLLIFSIVLHEVAHALAALKLGDPSAAREGRLSLNPLVHIDPFMTILLPATCYFLSGGTFIFGGAKPVPVNPYLFKNPRMGNAICAAAGPAVNLLIAAFFLLLLCIQPVSPGDSLNFHIFLRVAAGNWILAMFNLLPIPPLDGSQIALGILPWKAARVFDLPFFAGLILVTIFVMFGWDMIRPYVMEPFWWAFQLAVAIRSQFPGGPDLPRPW